MPELLSENTPPVPSQNSAFNEEQLPVHFPSLGKHKADCPEPWSALDPSLQPCCGARERQAAPGGSHCTHPFLPLLFSLGIGASWDDPTTQGPCSDLFHLSFGMRKEVIPGLKDGNAHWHHPALPGAASKPECSRNRFPCRDLL